MSPKAKSAALSAAPTEKEDATKVNFVQSAAEDPDFCFGVSKFEFPNGDVYEGEYCAHASGSVWRQGQGTYTTKDGQVYVGEWDGDKLLDTKEIQITYSDGTKYIGNLVKSKYSGSGVYQLAEKVSLTCNFQENKPTGDIILIDPNGKVWQGLAEKDESLLTQEHCFYQAIGKDLGKGRSRSKPIQKRDTISLKSSKESSTLSMPGVKYSNLRDIEKEVFAKSKKTPSDLQLHDSNWYQDYIKYCNLTQKVEKEGEQSLKGEEYNCYKKFKEFREIYTKILKDRENGERKWKQVDNTRLFQLIHSVEYKQKNKPVPVFYPTLSN